MIIFIESNTSGYGEHILHYCKEQQIDFIFVTDNIKKYSDLDSLKHSMNILSSHELNQQILSGKSSGRLYASTSDSQIFKAFVLSNKKEDTKFVETCRDKLKLQNLLYSNTFFAKRLSINTLDELNLTSLYVVKPNKGTGSMNILIDNGNQLKIDCLELV